MGLLKRKATLPKPYFTRSIIVYIYFQFFFLFTYIFFKSSIPILHTSFLSTISFIYASYIGFILQQLLNDHSHCLHTIQYINIIIFIAILSLINILVAC